MLLVTPEPCHHRVPSHDEGAPQPYGARVAVSDDEVHIDVDALSQVYREREPRSLAHGGLLRDVQAFLDQVLHLRSGQRPVHGGRNRRLRGHFLDAGVEIEPR
jgi:hypothetical protein